MAKRSRETSFSPSAEELSSSDTNETTSDADSGRSNKYQLVDKSTPAANTPVMRCSLPPHKHAVEFQSHEDYEVHYLKEHTNRCASCGKNFPTAHFLGLHIEENHNPLRETLQAKGEKTYGCFVEDCDRKCSTPQKRRLHLIDKHGFPKVVAAKVHVVKSQLTRELQFYNFRIVDHGIDRATSLLREGQKRRVSLSHEASQSIGHRRRASSQIQAATQVTNIRTLAETPNDVTQAETESHQNHINNSPHTQRPKEAISEEAKTSAPLVKEDMDDLEKSMSALRFVPTSVTLRNSKKS